MFFECSCKCTLPKGLHSGRGESSAETNTQKWQRCNSDSWCHLFLHRCLSILDAPSPRFRLSQLVQHWCDQVPEAEVGAHRKEAYQKCLWTLKGMYNCKPRKSKSCDHKWKRFEGLLLKTVTKTRVLMQNNLYNSWSFDFQGKHILL